MAVRGLAFDYGCVTHCEWLSYVLGGGPGVYKVGVNLPACVGSALHFSITNISISALGTCTCTPVV